MAQTILAVPLPEDVKKDFKVLCVRDGVAMKVRLANLITEFVEGRRRGAARGRMGGRGGGSLG